MSTVAISCLSREYGITTSTFFTAEALRICVSMSAIGSVIIGVRFLKRYGYQLDFVTPGTSPLFASSRKQIRHSSNFLIKARFRPHRQHRRTTRVENFGFSNERFDLTICACVAILSHYLFVLLKWKTKAL